VLRLAGAGYLVLLGVSPLLARAFGRHPSSGRPGNGTAPAGLRTAFLTGFAGDLLNPRIGLFYLAVVPQFVSAGASTLRNSLLLCAVDVSVAVVWLLALAWGAAAAVRWLHRPAVTRWSQGLFGAVLVALGTATAVGL
jgi:threonine/homoserine/homoserine lactone efflux protein